MDYGDDYSCCYCQLIARAAALWFLLATQYSALLNCPSLTCSHDCHHSIHVATHIDFVLSLVSYTALHDANYTALTISALMHIAYIINAVTLSLKQVLFQIYSVPHEESK